MEDADTLTLPDDPEVLKEIIVRERAEHRRQRDQIELKAVRLEVELLRLRKLYYRAKADKLTHPTDTAQLVLDFGQQLEALPRVEVEDVDAIADDGKPVDLRRVDLPELRKVRRGRRDLSA